MKRIALQGLELAPSQVWGGVRLVPLLRPHCPGDLRLSCRTYKDDETLVSLNDKTCYCSYIPHALIVSWSDDGLPVASFGGKINRFDGKQFKAGPISVRLMHRMARREEAHRLRFLPLNLAMEGFLALHFGGPDIAWEEYSRTALRDGLSCRSESSYSGYEITGLADALRIFEIHEQQVGVLIFVADALASAFVVSHPNDYRALHQTLIEDFYGELIYRYGYLYPHSVRMETTMDVQKISSLADIRQALENMRTEWANFQAGMAEGILERQVVSRHIYQIGPFQLQRFMTELELQQENHIGEAIVREDGTLEYLKTYRLSQAQVRRAHLLNQLANHSWNMSTTALALHLTYEEFLLRLEQAGFGYLVKESILKAARKRQKK
jgi:hypothetical protein